MAPKKNIKITKEKAKKPLKLSRASVTVKNGGEKKKRYYRKRFLYTEETLLEAVNSVKSGMSFLKTSLQYGIPIGTLYNKVKGKVPLERKMGPKTELTKEEEDRIEKWILQKAAIGYPMHSLVVRQAVKGVLDKIARPNRFNNNYPGVKWMQLFLRRHPKIKAKNAEILGRGRAAVTETKIRTWFEDVTKYLTEIDALDVLQDGNRVYNMDETSVALCPKTGKVLTNAKEKNVYTIAPGAEKQYITTLCCFSASGVGIRPMIMYAYQKYIPEEVIASVPGGYGIGKSENGWMTTASFYEYIVNCFYPQLLKNEVKFPVILFFDGHKSHISIELHDFCVEKNIILYCFVAHASHIMQPLDIGVFRSLKVFWRNAVSERAQKSTKPLTKAAFAPVFDAAYSKIKPEIVQKGFAKAGIFPFDAESVNYSRCIQTRNKDAKNSCNTDVKIEAESQHSNVPMDKSVDIELLIPSDVLEEFNEHLLLGTEPAQEKVLFLIWSQAKRNNEKLNILNDFEEISCESASDNESHDKNSTNDLKSLSEIAIENMAFANIEDIIIENIEDINSTFENDKVPDNISHTALLCDTIIDNYKIFSSEASNISKYDVLLEKLNIDGIEKSQSEHISSTPLMDTTAKEISTDNVSLSQNEEVPKNFPLRFSPTLFKDFKKNPSFSIPSTNKTDEFGEKSYSNLPKIGKDHGPSMEFPLDLSNQNVTKFSSKTMINNIDKSSSSSISSTAEAGKYFEDLQNKLHYSFSTDDIGKSNSSTDSIWKDHLHFPRIETSKIKKSKVDEAPIYALTSEQWKLKYVEKKKEEERIKNEKLMSKQLKEDEKEREKIVKQEELEHKRLLKKREKVQKLQEKQEIMKLKEELKEQKKVQMLEEKEKRAKIKEELKLQKMKEQQEKNQLKEKSNKEENKNIETRKKRKILQEIVEN